MTETSTAPKETLIPASQEKRVAKVEERRGKEQVGTAEEKILKTIAEHGNTASAHTLLNAIANNGNQEGKSNDKVDRDRETVGRLLDQRRKDAVKIMGRERTILPGRITASDIVDLHLVNALLAQMKQPGMTDPEAQSVLEFERKTLVTKMLRNVSREVVKDIYTHGKNVEALDEATKVKLGSFLQSECGKINIPAPFKNGQLDYRYALALLEKKLGGGELIANLTGKVFDSSGRIQWEEDLITGKTNPEEASIDQIMLGFECGKQLVSFETWRTIAETGSSVNMNSILDVEKLISSIHQGGIGSKQGVDITARSIVDHLGCRPWEVAEAMTMINVGIPPTEKVSPRIRRLATPYRAFVGISEYFRPAVFTPDVIRKMFDSANSSAGRNTFLEGIIFDSRIPVEEILKNVPGIKPEHIKMDKGYQPTTIQETRRLLEMLIQERKNS